MRIALNLLFGNLEDCFCNLSLIVLKEKKREVERENISDGQRI